MSKFELEPWEISSFFLGASSAEADHEVEFFWQGKKRVFLLRVVRLREAYGCTFAREKDSDSVGNWLLVDRSRGWLGVWNTFFKPPLDKVAIGIENGEIQLARFCVVTDGKQTRRALTLASGESLWLSASMVNQERFNLPLSETDFLRDGQTQLQVLTQELARPASDARFAANWLRWSTVKKQRYILGEQGLKNLEHLMCCVLLADGSLWELADSWAWDLYQGGVHLGMLYSPTQQLHRIEKQKPNYVQLAGLIVDKYPRIINTEDASKHRCLQLYYEGNFFWPMLWIQTPPTQHERLEAQLYLREWLQQNAPDRMDLLKE